MGGSLRRRSAHGPAHVAHLRLGVIDDAFPVKQYVAFCRLYQAEDRELEKALIRLADL